MPIRTRMVGHEHILPEAVDIDQIADALAALIASKVAKAGDTMTGDLTLDGANIVCLAAELIAGIINTNLLDKSAAETISGAYTHTDDITLDEADLVCLAAELIAGIINYNLLDKTADEMISGKYAHTDNLSVAEGIKILLDGILGDTYFKYNPDTAYLEGWVDGVKRIEL